LILIKSNLIKFIYRRNLKLGKKVRIDFNTVISISRTGVLSIGDNSFIRSKSKGYHGGMPFNSTLLIDKENALIEIGRNVHINGAYIHCQRHISIGNYCVIAAGVNILDSNGHIVLSRNRTIGRDDPSAIIIGNNVWIGLNSIILKGTIIGDNSIVGAGSVVKGNFPENSIIKGNPAVIITNLCYE